VPKAIIIGGTGQIGLAVARLLTCENWDVTLASRARVNAVHGFHHAVSDARDIEMLRGLIGSDTDLVLSCVAFDTADSDCLVAAGRDAGRIVAISSASVYRDGSGRTLDEAGKCGFPEFQNPLSEESLTVEAGPETYSTRKVAMEQKLIDAASCPVTILRPCAIHGPESKHAREWWFVKRLLDGRAAIPLAYSGQSRFQTTSVAAISEAILRAHKGKLPAIANVSDSDCPTVSEIGRAIMQVMDKHAELVGLVDDTSYPPKFGATPWSIPRPMICSAAATGTASYAEAVVPAVEWLVESVTSENWRDRLPQLAGYPHEHFDYEADEQALRLAQF
jgi:nucleoside-diphosphate-sugar epimerase